jgi:hypothetical protein
MSPRITTSFVACIILGACAQESAPPPVQPQPQPGPYPVGAAPPCRPSQPMCAPDRRAIVTACGNQLNLVQMCLGPAGCSASGNSLACDDSIARPGDPCRAEGAYGCTPEANAMIACRGGRQAVASSCKGSRGCASGAAIACDTSIADAGDPCDGEGSSACARDGRSLLRCTRGVFGFGQACNSSACLMTGGRILCQ